MRRYGRLAGFASTEAERSYFEAYDAALALSPVPLEVRDVATPPHGTTRVYVAGPAGAPPLIALHGKYLTATTWLELLPTFTATHRAHLVEGIGELGRTTTTRMLRNGTDVVAWLDAVLAGLQVRRAAFVGHSNGAFQTATYATERPERVERAALLAPAATFAPISAAWWKASLPMMVSTSRPRMERFWRKLSANPPASPVQRATDEQMLRAMCGLRSGARDAYPRTYDPERLSRMTMPVLVVFGRQDIIGDAERAAAKARAALPHAQVEIVDGGHMITNDEPARMAELLSKFLTAGAPEQMGAPDS